MILKGGHSTTRLVMVGIFLQCAGNHTEKSRPQEQRLLLFRFQQEQQKRDNKALDD